MSKTVLVGCRLPCGIVLDAPGIASVELNGANTALVPGAPGLTHVPEASWLYLSEYYASHHAFVNNAVFSHGSDKVENAAAMANDLKDEKTGFEGLDPNAPAPGVKPEDPAKLKAELNSTAAKAAPAKTPTSKADKAAAIALSQV